MDMVANLVGVKDLVDRGVRFVHENRLDENLAPSKIVDGEMPREITVRLMEMMLSSSSS